MGFDFGHFRGARGAKIKKLIEKVKALLQIKINCRKPDFKSHICIIQLYQKNKTVGNLIRGSLKGSKRIKKGEISMKTTEIREFDQHCNCKTVAKNK